MRRIFCAATCWVWLLAPRLFINVGAAFALWREGEEKREGKEEEDAYNYVL